jgi:hypothetical protein
MWPEHVGNVFAKAIQNIPILGRWEIVIDKKPGGRNELTADLIYRRAGKLWIWQ